MNPRGCLITSHSLALSYWGVWCVLDRCEVNHELGPGAGDNLSPPVQLPRQHLHQPQTEGT
jgi:hypothetical protein